ncbi:hypothetical protein Angca_008579 [Angiostrongylus cantonensis]|nr:hypothetical protein Angca_008579 [Angiostrongylus cantonensis]
MKVGFVETSRSEKQDMKEIGHLQNTMRPPWWQTDLCKLGFGVSGTGIAFENVDFMVWMQTSALPNFRKHYRTLDNEVDGFRDGLPNGVYTLVINYNYPAAWKGAEKLFIITRENWIGIQKEFLVFSYIACGVFLLVVSVIFLIIFIRQKLLRRTIAELSRY